MSSLPLKRLRPLHAKISCTYGITVHKLNSNDIFSECNFMLTVPQCLTPTRRYRCWLFFSSIAVRFSLVQKSPNARAAPPEALAAVSVAPTLAEQVSWRVHFLCPIVVSTSHPPR